MKKVIVNNVPYLAMTVEEKKNGIKLTGAFCINSDAECGVKTFGHYLKADLMGKVQDKKFKGSGVAYTVVELTAVEILALRECELKLEHARTVAVPQLISATFDSLLGK